MQIKSGPSGADVRYWQACIWGAMYIAHELWKGMFPDIPFVITSGCEGKHMDGSMHYRGLAGDHRTVDPGAAWALTDAQRNEYVGELRINLGDEYDVSVSPKYKNVHIELDPKKPLR